MKNKKKGLFVTFAGIIAAAVFFPYIYWNTFYFGKPKYTHVTYTSERGELFVGGQVLSSKNKPIFESKPIGQIVNIVPPPKRQPLEDFKSKFLETKSWSFSGKKIKNPLLKIVNI